MASKKSEERAREITQAGCIDTGYHGHETACTLTERITAALDAAEARGPAPESIKRTMEGLIRKAEQARAEGERSGWNDGIQRAAKVAEAYIGLGATAAAIRALQRGGRGEGR